MLELQQAMASLGLALDIGKTLIEMRDDANLQSKIVEFNAAIIDAQSKIMASQNAQTLLSRKVDELKQECVRLKDWETERKQYTRKEIATGVFAYIDKGYVGELKNAHKYCCNCFDNQKRSTLQKFDTDVGRRVGLCCHNGCPDLIFYKYIDS